MDQETTTITYNISFKSWTIKELTMDKTTSTESLSYNVKQDWVFKNEFKLIIAALTVTVATDQTNPEGTTVCKLVLSCELSAEGLTNQVPKQVFGEIGMILVHTARGILLHEGMGTIFARYPVPMYTVEQLAGM